MLKNRPPVESDQLQVTYAQTEKKFDENISNDELLQKLRKKRRGEHNLKIKKLLKDADQKSELEKFKQFTEIKRKQYAIDQSSNHKKAKPLLKIKREL